MGLKIVNDFDLEGILLEGKLCAVAFISANSIYSDFFLPEFETFSGIVLMPCYQISETENPRIVNDLKIQATPTTCIYRDGSEIFRLEGPYSSDALDRRVKEVIQ
jgi:hypothetical protein